MKKFVFDIEERAVGAGEHSWFAIEEDTNEEIPMPEGGNTIDGRSFVGQYPEIQEYLASSRGLDFGVC